MRRKKTFILIYFGTSGLEAFISFTNELPRSLGQCWGNMMIDLLPNQKAPCPSLLRHGWWIQSPFSLTRRQEYPALETTLFTIFLWNTHKYKYCRNFSTFIIIIWQHTYQSFGTIYDKIDDFCKSSVAYYFWGPLGGRTVASVASPSECFLYVLTPGEWVQNPTQWRWEIWEKLRGQDILGRTSAIACHILTIFFTNLPWSNISHQDKWQFAGLENAWSCSKTMSETKII